MELDINLDDITKYAINFSKGLEDPRFKSLDSTLDSLRVVSGQDYGAEKIVFSSEDYLEVSALRSITGRGLVVRFSYHSRKKGGKLQYPILPMGVVIPPKGKALVTLKMRDRLEGYLLYDSTSKLEERMTLLRKTIPRNMDAVRTEIAELARYAKAVKKSA